MAIKLKFLFALVTIFILGIDASPVLPLLQDGLMHWMHATDLLISSLQGSTDVPTLDPETSTLSSIGLQLFNGPKAAFLSFLENHPEWTKSTADFTSELVQAKLKSPLSDKGNELVQNFNTYLDENPKLKLSTSEFVSDWWKNSVIPSTQERIAILKSSPLAQNTKNFISSIQSFELKGGSGSSPVSSAGSVNKNIIADVSRNLNGGFDSLLNKYPKLKLSTSEFVGDYLENTAIPKVQSTLEFLDRSPLAKSSREFAARSTADVAQEFFQGVGQVTKPATDLLGLIGTRLVTKLTEPIVSGVDGAIDLAAKSLQEANQYLAASAPTPTTDDVAALSNRIISPEGIKTVSSAIIKPELLQNLPDRLDSLLSSSGAAVVRAVGTFGEELSKSQDILVTNTVAFGGKFTNGISTIFNDAVNVFPSKSGELLSQGITKVQGFVGEESNNLVQTITAKSSATVNSLQDVVTSKLGEASNWKLFTDDKHWETGYWEQQIQKIAKTGQQLVEVSKDASKRESLISETRSGLSQLANTISSNWNRIQSGNPNFQQLNNLLETDPTKIAQPLPKLRVNEISGSMQSITSAVSNELQAFTKDASHFVNDFIKTNEMIDY